jgi:hypothetical protein
MDQETIDGLSPGIRELVVWLAGAGFPTVDSGDGSNYEAGMEGAVPYPMVVVLSEPELLVEDARAIKRLLEDRGVSFNAGKHVELYDGEGITWPQIQATYDPHDESAVIVILNVLSKDVEIE